MEQNTKQRPTESQIEVLMSDWLGNLRQGEEGNYTHKGKGGIKTNRERGVRDYILGNVRGLDNIELMKQARIAAEKVINTVTPFPVTVQVGGGVSCHTQDANGRHAINVASDYFDDNSLTAEQKTDIMLGLATHEASHAAFTDNSIQAKNMKGTPAELEELKHSIWNIIEDERIEYLVGEQRPGLSDCLAETKGYYFKKLVCDMRTNGKMPTEPIPKLLAAITQAVRYPSEMTREDVEENFDDLDQIRLALTPYPLDPQEAWNATERIMDIIRDKAEKEMDKQEQEQEQQQNQNQQKQEENKQQDSSSSSPSSENKQAKDGHGGQNGSSDNKKQHTKKEVEQAIAKALQSTEGQKVMSAIRNDEHKSEPNNSANNLHDEMVNDYVNNDDSERIGSGGEGGGAGNITTFIKKPKGKQDIYLDHVNRIRAYVPAMSRALRCKSEEKEYVLRGQPKGKLDTNKLVSLSTGNDKIFRKSGSVTCSSASVCMLIDESGSMDGQKLIAAREAAILVNEAIKRINNVRFFCYGYTTKLLNVYSENNRISPWALSDTQALGGTPTGQAMEICGKRVRKYTKDPVIMLVLTDGAAHDSVKVIEQDQLLRKQGIYPVGVGILTNAVVNTFKDNIIMMDISTFATDMGKLTKKKLDKLLVRKDSNA